MKNPKRKAVLAGAGLILTTVIWGSGFVVMKASVDAIPPTYLMALRFTIAAAGLALIFIKKLGKISKKDLFPGCLLGIWLSACYLFQTYGLKYTTASNNAFITTFYVIIVPFLHYFINHIRISRYTMAATLLAIVGLGLLSLDGSLTLNLGDRLTLICSFCYAVHIMLLDRFTKKHDPIILTLLQFLSATAFCWLLAPVLEGPFNIAAVLTPSLTGGLLYLGLCGTMICFVLQSIGQKYVAPAMASILLSLECVFGAFFAVIFLGDPVTVRILAGCGLMFGAVLLSQKQ